MIEPRAWMISDPDGELATAVTMRPQNPVSETGLVIDKLVTVADVLAALRQPSEAMVEAGGKYCLDATNARMKSIFLAMLNQFEKALSSC